MPTKWLPNAANLDHLKHQAKDLLRDFRAGKMAAFQRVREFHPHFIDRPDKEMAARKFILSDAQLTIAREYGYASWPRLKTVIAEKRYEDLRLSHGDRVPDGPFKQALNLMDTGDEAGLRRHLAAHPGLVHEKASFEGGNYFSTPTLLEFLPQNPIRQERLPANAVKLAEIVLEAGARDDQEAMNQTLLLAASGSLIRECGLQVPILRLLCRSGADPAFAMQSALAHGEFESVQTLIDCGAPVDLPTAATLGEKDLVARLSRKAEASSLQLALALAANTDHAAIVRILIASGADPNRYNPPGGHSHCTPLHSAVASDQFETVVALVEGGADPNIEDIHHQMTPLEWADYMKRERIAGFLRSQV